jgi:hypothetical protein
MTARTITAYPGAPVPAATHRAARAVLFLACAGLGAVIGWRLGK